MQDVTWKRITPKTFGTKSLVSSQHKCIKLSHKVGSAGEASVEKLIVM